MGPRSIVIATILAFVISSIWISAGTIESEPSQPEGVIGPSLMFNSTRRPERILPFIGYSHGLFSENILGQISSKPENEPIRVIVRLKPAELDSVGEEEVVRFLKKHANETQAEVIDFLERGNARILNRFWLANAMLVEATKKTLMGLRNFPSVVRIHEDFKVRVPEAEKSSSNPSAGVTWGLERIGAPQAWGLGIDGSGIRVAVLDTGVEITHPDLVGKMWTDNPADPTYPGGWIEFDANGNVVVGSIPHDTAGHGTHTSGTVVGDNASGVAIGVAPGAWLMHALILPYGGGTFPQVVAGMQWAVDPFDQYGNPAGQRAHLASMSWGAYGYRAEMIEPIRNMVAAGVVPVAAIGNAGEGITSSPGNVYESFGVGAIDATDEVPAWSSGEIVNWPESYPESYIKPDFSAPGVAVYSSVPWGWEYWSGTSMATPHVAGAGALMLDANPNLTADDIRDVLRMTADDLGDPGKDTRYGWGIINAYQATLVVQANCGVIGHVVDQETSAGIAGAEVLVQEMGWTKLTSENGYFKIFLPPGDYTLRTKAFGYYDNFFSINVVENVWLFLNIPLEPKPRGFIAGRVTDNLLNPIENARVEVLRTPLKVWTDVMGNYSIEAPIGTYDVKAWAWGFKSNIARGVQVLENQTTVVSFQLEPTIRVAVLGDHLGQIVKLLMENDIAAEERDWDFLPDIQTYDAVVLNLPRDPGSATFLSLLEASARHKVGLVFTSSWPAPGSIGGRRYGITLLSRYTGDPLGESNGYGWGTVYYQLLSEHPIFEGFRVRDNIGLITGGWQDFAWFFGYRSGRVIADIGAAAVGIQGSGVGVSLGENNKHVLLAGLAPQPWTNIPHWTDNAKLIFLRAVWWASAPPVKLPKGFVVGRVTDNEPNPIENALVWALGTRFKTTTDNEGNYFLQLPVGTYDLRVSAYGYLSSTRTIEVLENQTTIVNFQLRPFLALLIQDSLPWGVDANRSALEEFGISYDVVSSWAVGTLDLNRYDFVMYSSDQPYSYYSNLASNLDKISFYVVRGGLLIAHCCDGGWNGGDWRGISILPGEVKHLMYRDGSEYGSNLIHIVDPSHEVITGCGAFTLTDDYLSGWNWSTHGIFVDLFKGTSIITISAEADGGDGPTYIDYGFGRGKVLATMQTVEWGYSRRGRQELLRNELRFALKWSPPSPPPLKVFTWISPSSQMVSAGDKAEFSVTLLNLGRFEDNYVLTVDDTQGWGLVLSETRVENVGPDENRVVKLEVQVPENAAICALDTVTVTVTSEENSAISTSDNCSVAVGYKKIIPTYRWIPRVSTTSVVSGDDVGTWVYLPFEFPFWGQPKTRVYVCSNGFLIFDPTPPTNDFVNSFGKLKASCMIAPFWDDLRTDIAGGLVSAPGVYMDSYEDKVVITWEATAFGWSEASIKFQVVLYRSGALRMSIDNATNFWYFSPTLGISKGDGVKYLDLTQERSILKSWHFAVKKLDLDLSVHPSHQSQLPGSVTRFNLWITNCGVLADTYELMVQDNLDWTITLSKSLFENLEAGGIKAASIEVQIPPDVYGCTSDGIQATLASAANPLLKDEEGFVAHAKIVRKVEISVSPFYQSAPTKRMLNYTVTVTNIGNVPDTYDLRVAEAGWYGVKWSRRKPIIIRNPGPRLEDHQIRIIVDYDEDMLENFDDLRFTDNDGFSELPYWIEEFETSENAVVWVKVPVIPAHENKMIYMYYGNPDASSVSNGEGVFDFFDDFRNLDKWHRQGTLSETLMAEGRTVVKVTSGSSDPEGIYTRDYLNVENKIIEYLIKGFGGSDLDAAMYVDRAWSPNFYGSNNLNHITGDQYPGNQHAVIIGGQTNFGTQFTSNNWERAITTIKTGEIIGTYRGETLSQLGSPFHYEGFIALQADPDGSPEFRYYFVDWLFVRKYASPEPVVLVEEEEEMGLWISWLPRIIPTSISLLPGESGHAMLSIRVPTAAEYCTTDNLVIRAISRADPSVRAHATCIAHSQGGVRISITPDYQSGLPNEKLEFRVLVKNTSNRATSYSLSVTDNRGWAPSISDNLLENVAPGENRVVSLTVVIPDNAYGCTNDNLSVIAVSVENMEVSDNDWCIIHATVVRKVELKVSPEFQRAFPGKTLTFNVVVTNMGNVMDTYELRAYDIKWYDLRWSRRKAITIVNQGPKLENYQVKIPLTYEEEMLESFEDLRFVDNDHESTLSYWIESYIPRENAIVWVRVPLIPENDNKLIYLYYGNPSAASESDVDKTFDLFDDFERGTLSPKWTPDNGTRAGAGTHTSKSGSYSMYTRFGAVTVTSRSINLTGSTSALVSYWIRRGSDEFSEDPDSGEDLVVEYLNKFDVWVELDHFLGEGIPGEIFDRTKVLPADAMHKGFKLRFRQLRGSGHHFDYWHMDDIIVRKRAIPKPTPVVGEEEVYTGWEPRISPRRLTRMPKVSRVAILSVSIPLGAEHCTADNIVIEIISLVDPSVQDQALCIAHATTRAVKVSISPLGSSDYPGTPLTFEVTVTNTGIVEDSFNLRVKEELGWGAVLSVYKVEDLAPSENQTLTLHLTIPENVVGCTTNRITVIASSAVDPSIENSGHCLVHAWEPVWRIENVDTQNVGWYASVALDSEGRPYISYYDVANKDLKLAKQTNAGWACETVDSKGNVGGWTSLELDSEGRPHISYYDFSNRCLKYARWTGSSWTIEIVDDAWEVGKFSSLALDSQDRPHIAYWDERNHHLKYAVKEGSSWRIERVDTIGEVGMFCSLVLGPEDEPHIAYYGDWYLKYAQKAEGRWIKHRVARADVSTSASLALDLSGRPHIAYFDLRHKNLCYARLTDEGWQIETVDGAGNVGWHPSLVLDHYERAHISYLDLTRGVLKYARSTGLTWKIKEVRSAHVSHTGPTSLALSARRWPHICYLDLDRTNYILKYARANILRAVEVRVAPSYRNGLPGERLTYSVEVRNLGNILDIYTLTTVDNLGWGLGFSPSLIAVGPKSAENAVLSVNIPYDAIGCSKDNVVITATSFTDKSISSFASCTAHAGAVRLVQLSIYPNYQSGFEQWVTYSVEVKNMGNVLDSYNLKASDNAEWLIEILPDLVEISPGQSYYAALNVWIPRAETCTKNRIIVTATSREDPAVSNSASCIAHVRPPGEAIVQGDNNAFNIDQTGDPPWKWYDSHPLIMVSGKVGHGRAVATGAVATCRDGRWIEGEWDVLFDKMFQWLKPRAKEVLWYEGHNVYNNTDRCGSLIATLREKGYTIEGKLGEITYELLREYDVVVLPQLQEGAPGTGGDPTKIKDSEVEAVVKFVKEGGGLLIMESSDYAGYNFYKVQNKFLTALNFGILFQSDQVCDEDFPREYWFDAEVLSKEFGADYRNETGKTKVKVYNVCSLATVSCNYEAKNTSIHFKVKGY